MRSHIERHVKVMNSLYRLRDEVFQCCSVGFATIAFQARSFNHSDISCAHELHAFGGEASGPQPHPNFIEVSR